MNIQREIPQKRREGWMENVGIDRARCVFAKPDTNCSFFFCFFCFVFVFCCFFPSLCLARLKSQALIGKGARAHVVAVCNKKKNENKNMRTCFSWLIKMLRVTVFISVSALLSFPSLSFPRSDSVRVTSPLLIRPAALVFFFFFSFPGSFS